MNKILLFFILLFCLPVHADWSKPFIIRENDGFKIYFDFNNIATEDGGNKILYWMKVNYFSPDKGALSATHFIVINCKRNEYTIDHTSSYSKVDLQGKLLYQGAPNITLPIEDGTSQAIIKESWCVL